MPEEDKPNQYCFQLGQLNVNQAEEGKKNVLSPAWLTAEKLLQTIGIGIESSLILIQCN